MTDTIHTALRACHVDAPDAKGAMRHITIALATSRLMDGCQRAMLKALRAALHTGDLDAADKWSLALVENYAD